MLSLSQIIQRINHSAYKLDAIGVVGLFGGDRAADALETIHLYKSRRWAGWYNYPGGLTVAMRFGQMANSRFWGTIFPGPNRSPAFTFGLAGELESGPDYSRAYSGTTLNMGYLGRVVSEECADYSSKRLYLTKKDGSEGRWTGSSAVVTIISFPPRRHEMVVRSRTMTGVRVTKNYEYIPIEPKSDPPLALWAIVPSLVSILASVFCFLGHDPLCASLILFGVLSSGFSSLVLGSANLGIRVPMQSAGSPPGDGLTFLKDGIIVFKGQEADMNMIIKGEFILDYSTGILPHPKHHTIGISSLLLVAQVLVQFISFHAAPSLAKF